MIRQGHEYTEELNALATAAEYTMNRAAEIRAEAERLSVLASTALVTGFDDPGVTAMKGRAEAIHIRLNDIDNALTEIETQVDNL